MAYVQSKVMKKRLQEKRRVSGAALLREELNSEAGNTSASLLDSLPAFEKNKGVMMANFEEWIKMATDNKINTTNSWNFALIDYFHDLNVLREGDNNINFQKASATLDGCVKIYSSRVDSVATETGRLLSGLATRKNDSPDPEDGDGDMDDENEDDADGEELDPTQPKRKTSSKKVKESGSTLTSFENIKVKKLTQELSIDPLFKKTLAEFDEGGAKSLLLNTLHMDDDSRVVFDASTTGSSTKDIEKETVKLEDISEEAEEDVEMSTDESEVDISQLKQFLFRYDDSEYKMEGVTLCPSMGHLNTVLQDINKAKSILTEFNAEETVQSYGADAENFDDFGGSGDGYGDSDDNENSYGDLDEEAAAVILQNDVEQEDAGNDTGVVSSIVDQDLMAYFDNTLRRNWAGPEHWKVRQLKKGKANDAQSGDKTTTKKVREKFSINFMDLSDEAMEDEKVMFAKGRTHTVLPQAEWDQKNLHLLPDDMNFSSDVLTKLFLKPSQRMNVFRKKITLKENKANGGDDYKQAEATIWNQNYKELEEEEHALPNGDERNDDDDDFYGADDFGGGMDFDDLPPSTADGKTDIGSQLITGGAKAKPDSLSYSKKAKNVNVKKLKDNMWKSIEVKKEQEEERQFSDIVQDIEKMYPRQQKKELSTSFCFICLLHLANEHGLTIENGEELKDLKVTGFS